MILGLGGNSEDVEDDGEANQRRPYISSNKLSGDKETVMSKAVMAGGSLNEANCNQNQIHRKQAEMSVEGRTGSG